MKYTLLALLALMSAPKGVAVNEQVWKDMIHEIESSTNDIEEIRNYALSMLFESDQNEAKDSAINNIEPLRKLSHCYLHVVNSGN